MRQTGPRMSALKPTAFSISNPTDMTYPFWLSSESNSHLRGEVEQIRRAQRRARRRRSSARRERVNELEGLRAEVEFLSLTLTSLLAQLDHKGTVTRTDLREVMISVDEYDGKLDGRLPVAALEELLRPPVLEELDDDGLEEGDEGSL